MKAHQSESAKAQPERDPSRNVGGADNALAGGCVRLGAHLGNQRLGRMLQRKLSVSHPGDFLEIEADRVADEVIRTSELGSSVHAARPHVQRTCAECEQQVTLGALQEDHCMQRQAPGRDDEAVVPRDEAQDAVADIDPLIESRIDALRGAGQPLSEGLRSFMEPRLGGDFDAVRIHTDTRAAELARAVDAQAFTVGYDVVFGSGRYAPDTASGKHLLAHELTHVMQQAAGRLQPRIQRTIDPNTPDGARTLIEYAGRILHPSNVIGEVNHTNVGDVPESWRYMLYTFWRARLGSDRVEGRYVEVGGERRRELLHEGLRYARPLVDRVQGAAQGERLQEIFWAHYYYVESDTFFDEARAQVEQATRGGAGSQPLVATPERHTEQVLGAVVSAQQALDALRTVISTSARFGGSEADRAAAEVLRQVDAGRSLEGVKTMPVLQGIFYVRSVLNTIEAIHQLSQLGDRAREAQRHPNLFATTTDLLQQTTRLLEGVFALSCGFASVVAQLSGNTSQAAAALALGTRSLRVIGTIGAGFQFLYGFSVLLQSDATSEQRRTALLNVGLGGAGLASTLSGFSAFSFLQGMGGPLTVGVLVTAAEVSWLRSEIAGFERGFMSFGLQGAYEILQDRAGLLAPAANQLAVALEQQRQAPAPADPSHPESSLRHGLSDVARSAAQDVRDRIQRTLDRMTRREPGYPIIQEPSGYPALRRRFEPLRAQLAAASTPEEVLLVARNTLETIRLAFREYDQIYLEELRSVHRDSTLLGGMHGADPTRTTSGRETAVPF